MIFKGSKGGGGSFKQTPDNLRSEDTFEGVLGLAIGPLKGPVGGLKGIKLDGTPLEDASGDPNFGTFTALIGDGDPAKFPQKIQLKLGSGASPVQIGLQLGNPTSAVGQGSPGPWATRTLNNVNAEFIDLRFIAEALYKQDKKGIWNNTATIEIQMKPIGKVNWINPMLSGPAQPAYDPDGYAVYDDFYGDLRAILPKLALSTQYGGAVGPNYAITGKTTSPAVYELRISVPNTAAYANTGWDVRARLLEREHYDVDPDVEERRITWESMAGVYPSVLGEHEDWRGVAWMQLYGKASDQLNGVPEITSEWHTKIISVPVNFNPDTRAYTGTWDGSWKKAYTNDPAWVVNDAISDSLSGLALLAPGSHLNKWDGLELSKWAGQQVPDGNGGAQPRYSLNLSVSSPMKAEEFVRYLAGAVGALAWDVGDGEWRMKIDKPDTPVDIFTLDNIENEFVYSHTDVDTRFNDITGQFKNAEMDYRQDAVRLYDSASIAKIGHKPTSIVLVGATHRQEALRRVKLRLRSTINETRVVNFTTNRRGRNVDPLDLILVADGDLGDQDKRTTGRVLTISPDRKTITVRDPMRLETGVAYKLRFAQANSAYNPDTLAEPVSVDWKKPTVVAERTVTNIVPGEGLNTVTLTLNTVLPLGVPEFLAVALEAATLATLPRLYRALNVVYSDDGEHVSISAIEVDTGKWDASDNVTGSDTVFQDLRGVVPKPLAPPGGQILSLLATPSEQGKNLSLVSNWQRPHGAFVSGFMVKHRINGGEWKISAERTQYPSIDFHNPPPGEYEVAIYTLDRRGGISEPLTASLTVTQALLDATDITYSDGTYLDSLKPGEIGATAGARVSINLRDQAGTIIPNDATIKNSGITISPNGSINGAGGGSVTIGGLGYGGDLLATRNRLFVQGTDPGAVENGAFWIDTSVIPNITRQRLGGAWVIGSSYGARAGLNLFDSATQALMDAQIKNSAISVSSNGAINGAGGGQVTIGGLGYVGELNATRNISERAINRNSSFNDGMLGWIAGLNSGRNGSAAVSAIGTPNAIRGNNAMVLGAYSFVRGEQVPVTPGETIYLAYRFTTTSNRVDTNSPQWYVGVEFSSAMGVSPVSATYIYNNTSVSTTAGAQVGVVAITIPAGYLTASVGVGLDFGQSLSSGSVGVVDYLEIHRDEPGSTVGARAGTNLIDSVSSILNDSAIKNTAITLANNGTINGAGGGAITIGGLGYTGALNATYGAKSGFNLTDSVNALLTDATIKNTAITLSSTGTINGAGGGAVTMPGLDTASGTGLISRTSKLSAVTGRITDPMVYNTQSLLGPSNTTNLAPAYTMGESNVTITLPAHVRKIAGPSGPISLSYGAIVGTLAFGAYWIAYIDDPDLTGIVSPAANFTSNPDNLLYPGRYQVAEGIAPQLDGSGGSTGSGGGGRNFEFPAPLE